MADSKQAENSAITEALYSQTEIHDLPIRIQTQFVRDDKPIAKLSVLTFVNLHDLPHRQTDGKNTNELRMVAAIFDRNGKYIGAIDRKIAVQWSDDNAGITNSHNLSFLVGFRSLTGSGWSFAMPNRSVLSAQAASSKSPESVNADRSNDNAFQFIRLISCYISSKLCSTSRRSRCSDFPD